MKKIICIIVCIVLCFAAQGCGETENGQTNTAEQTTQEAVQAVKTEWQLEYSEYISYYIRTKNGISGYCRESAIDWEETGTYQKLNISVYPDESAVVFSSLAFDKLPQSVKVTIKDLNTDKVSKYWGKNTYGIISFDETDSLMISTNMLIGNVFEITFSTNEKEFKYTFETAGESYQNALKECYKHLR